MQGVLADLNARPLYLNVQAGAAGHTLSQCAQAWPAWRERLLARRPAHRPATADAVLLTALTWPVSMLHLAVAFLYDEKLEGEVRVDWPDSEERPFGNVSITHAALVPSADPLSEAAGQLLLACDTLAPAMRLSRPVLLNVTLDRAVQALQVLGQATQQQERAAQWAERLTREWPTRNRTHLDPQSGTLTRTSCCCHYIDARRCANCPVTGNPTTPTSRIGATP